MLDFSFSIVAAQVTCFAGQPGNEGNAKTVVPVNGRPPTTLIFVEVAGSLMVIPCNDASMVLVLVVWHCHLCFHHPSSAISKPAISVKAGHAGTEAHAQCLVLTPVPLWVVEIHQALVSLGKKHLASTWLTVHGFMVRWFISLIRIWVIVAGSRSLSVIQSKMLSTFTDMTCFWCAGHLEVLCVLGSVC